MAVVASIRRGDPEFFLVALGWAHRSTLSALVVMGILSESAKIALLVGGAAIVIPLGACAWLEAWLIERHATCDPRVVAKVFP